MSQSATQPREPNRHFHCVLADDLSGAAEIAGAALRYGLSAAVTTQADVASGNDVQCVDMDTRILPELDAVQRVRQMTAGMQALGACWIFKKTDSLLRGHVRQEVLAMLGASGRSRCLLCPANPSRGRIVRGGRYFVDGVPLDQTVFANDPLHPRRSSFVAELLGGADPRLAVPDVTSREDLRELAGQMDDATLPAGGVEFFEALLAAQGFQPRPTPLPALTGIRLFVCGSPAGWAAGRESQAAHYGIATVRLRDNPIVNCESELRRTGQVQLAIADAAGEPSQLSEDLAEVVITLLNRCHVDLMFLEGGATAVTVLRRLGWATLRGVAELAPGAVLLENEAARSPRLVIKPGSYPWPELVYSKSLAQTRNLNAMF